MAVSSSPVRPAEKRLDPRIGPFVILAPATAPAYLDRATGVANCGDRTQNQETKVFGSAMALPSKHPTWEDPALAALAKAPIDDEPTTDEDRAALAEGRAARAAGDVLTTEELRRLLEM